MNGYTKITINGKDVGLKFGMMAIRMFGDKSEKVKLYEGETLNEIGIATLLYGGYVNNCTVKEADTELTFEDFVEFTEIALLDKEVLKQIEEAIKVWAESRYVKASTEKVSEEAKKKSLAGKKSKKS